MSITDAGKLFYERSKQVLEAADEAVAAVTPGDPVLRGTLRISAPQGLWGKWCGPRFCSACASSIRR